MNTPVSKQMLSTSEMLILSSEMNKREKSLPMAFLMLLLGHLGIHRFYLKKYVSGAIQCAIFLVALISYILVVVFTGVSQEFYIDGYVIPMIISICVFAISALGLTVWVIVDACLLTGQVKRWNADLEQSIIQEIVQFRMAQQPEPNHNPL